MLDSRLAEKLAWVLSRPHGAPSSSAEKTDVAFIVIEPARIARSVVSEGCTAENTKRVYFARHAATAKRRSGTSAIVKLIQGLYDTCPEQARRLVRSRIYATRPATASCHGMVRVAARRLADPVAPRDHELPLTGFEFVPVTEVGPPAPPPLPALALQARTPSQWMAVAKLLARQVQREGPLYARDRAIAAVLVEKNGSPVGWAVNTNASNRTRHAEINLLQNYAAHSNGRGIESGMTLYSTLKPCRMCAGMIWEMAEDASTLDIVYEEHDPGPNGRETILDARSFDRKRVAVQSKDETLLDLVVQRRLPLEGER